MLTTVSGGASTTSADAAERVRRDRNDLVAEVFPAVRGELAGLGQHDESLGGGDRVRAREHCHAGPAGPGRIGSHSDDLGQAGDAAVPQPGGHCVQELVEAVVARISPGRLRNQVDLTAAQGSADNLRVDAALPQPADGERRRPVQRALLSSGRGALTHERGSIPGPDGLASSWRSTSRATLAASMRTHR